MQLSFTKMQGLGNDFVVLDGVRQKIALSHEQYQHLADRHFGIGCDQILLVEPATDAANDFKYRIFNSDGGEVEHCGNGARCFLRFVREHGLSTKERVRVETAKGTIEIALAAHDQVTVDMGVPRFLPAEIPFAASSSALSYPLGLPSGAQVQISVANVGNPHAVMQVDNVDSAPVAELGPQIEAHSSFPQRTNAGFMQVVSRQAIRLRVFERGAGETLACGTGACAAVAVGIRLGLLDQTVSVHTRGGELTITWAGEGTPLHMTGPAVTVYQGQIEL